MVKNPPANAGDARDVGLIPGSRRSLAVGNDNLLQPVFLPRKSRLALSATGPQLAHFGA